MVITLPFMLLLLTSGRWEKGFGGGIRRSLHYESLDSGSSDTKRHEESQRPSQDYLSEKVFPVPQFDSWRFLLKNCRCWRSALAALPLLPSSAQRAGKPSSIFRCLSVRRKAGECHLLVRIVYMESILAHATCVSLSLPKDGRPAWELGLAVLFLVSVSGLVWKHRLTRPYLATGWLWYLGTLVPVIGLVQVGDQAMADRYAYTPLIGIFVMVAWGAAELTARRQVSLQLCAAIAAVILATLSFLTWRQIGYWSSDYDLWSHTVQVTKHNVVADESLSKTLMQLGRPQEAVAGFEEAASLNPGDPFRHVNLAAAFLESKRPTDAIAEYQSTIQVTSDPVIQARCYESIATIYDQIGDYAKVRDNYRLALQADPTQGPGMIDRISQYAAGAPSAPRYLQLGMLLQEVGKLHEASVAYRRALELDPALAEAKKSMAAMDPGKK